LSIIDSVKQTAEKGVRRRVTDLQETQADFYYDCKLINAIGESDDGAEEPKKGVTNNYLFYRRAILKNRNQSPHNRSVSSSHGYHYFMVCLLGQKYLQCTLCCRSAVQTKKI